MQQSFYQGRNYLIKGTFNNQAVFIVHSEALPDGTEVCFEIFEALIRQRLNSL